MLLILVAIAIGGKINQFLLKCQKKLCDKKLCSLGG